MNESRQEKLNQVLGKLLDSYREYSEIELIGSVGLPAKDSIIKLVDDILVVLYPGLIRQESFDHLNLPYLAGQKLVSSSSVSNCTRNRYCAGNFHRKVRTAVKTRSLVKRLSRSVFRSWNTCRHYVKSLPRMWKPS